MRLKSSSGSMSSINVRRLDLNEEEIPENLRNKIRKKESRVTKKPSFLKADEKKSKRKCEEDCSGSDIDNPINDPINDLPDQITDYWGNNRWSEFIYSFIRMCNSGNHKHHSLAPNRNWNGITITLNIFAVLALIAQISSIYPGH